MLPAAIEVLTLFVEDLDATQAFYQILFEPEVVFEDDVGAVLTFSGMMLNILLVSAAPELVTPTAVGAPYSAPRMMLTLKVDICDAACA